MSLTYFTHLHVTDDLDVRLDLGRVGYYVDTQDPTDIIINVDHIKFLQVDDPYSVDSLLRIGYASQESTTITDSIEDPTALQPLRVEQVVEDVLADSLYRVDNSLKISDRLTRNLAYSARYYNGGYYQPTVPEGYTVVSFYQDDLLVAELQNYIIPAKELNSTEATLLDLAYGFIYALANSDHTLLGELFKTVIYLFTKFSYLPSKFTRYKPEVLEQDTAAYDLSFFTYSLIQAIKYYVDRPVAVGLSLGEITDEIEEVLRWLSREISGRVDLVSGFVYDPHPSIKSSYWASIALGELLSLTYDIKVHETAAWLYLAIKEAPHPEDGTPESYLQATSYLWKTLNNLDTTGEVGYVRSHRWCDVNTALLWTSILPSEELSALNVVTSFSADGSKLISVPDLGLITPANLHQIALAAANAEKLVRKTSFYLYAEEAKGYVLYLHQLAYFMWPTGRLWVGENSVNNGLINQLLAMVSQAAYGTVLQLFMLQDSNRVRFLQANHLINYKPKPFMMSDKHWATWLNREKELTTVEDKAKHWGLVDLGLNSTVRTPLTVNNLDVDASNMLDVSVDIYQYSTTPAYKYLDYWLSKIPYDIKLGSSWSRRDFDFANPKDSDPLFYRQRALSIAEAEELGVFYKYEARSTPGFSYYIDAGSLITVADPLEVTVDRDYAVRPLSDYAAQCKISTGWVYNKLPTFTPPGHVVTIRGHTLSPVSNLLESTNKLVMF